MSNETPLASSKEVAEYLGVTTNTLARIRTEGEGPDFIRVGTRNIRYRWEAVQEWLNSNAHTTTKEYVT